MKLDMAILDVHGVGRAEQRGQLPGGVAVAFHPEEIRIVQGMVFHQLVAAMIDQASRQSERHHGAVDVQELAMIDSQVGIRPVDVDCGRFAGFLEAGAVEGDVANAERLAFAAGDENQAVGPLILRRPGRVVLENGLADAGARQSDGFVVDLQRGHTRLKGFVLARAGGNDDRIAVVRSVDGGLDVLLGAGLGGLSGGGTDVACRTNSEESISKASCRVRFMECLRNVPRWDGMAGWIGRLYRTAGGSVNQSVSGNAFRSARPTDTLATTRQRYAGA